MSVTWPGRVIKWPTHSPAPWPALWTLVLITPRWRLTRSQTLMSRCTGRQSPACGWRTSPSVTAVPRSFVMSPQGSPGPSYLRFDVGVCLRPYRVSPIPAGRHLGSLWRPSSSGMDSRKTSVTGPSPVWSARGRKHTVTPRKDVRGAREAVWSRECGPGGPPASLRGVYSSGWVARFVVPSDLILDWGSQFTSELWSTVAQGLGVKLHRTTAYHPQAK